jgi:biopolymer transport protein ExbB
MFEAIESSFRLMSKGGFVMIPIVLCSIIALTIIIERLIYLKKCQEDPDKFFSGLKNNLKDKKSSKALEICKNSPGPLGRIMEAGIQNKNNPTWKLSEILSVTAQEEVNRMNKNIRALEVIAIISPLMGLLGTVVGMVQAFNRVAEYKGQVDPSILAGGIWEALLTTAAGLSVAIPVTIMLHYFERKIEERSFLISKFGQMLIHHFDEENQPKGTDGKSGYSRPN